MKLKRDILPTNGLPPHQDEITLDDLGIRLVLIPLFGLAIPNLTGLVDNSAYSIGWLLFHYAYFISLAFIIYHGNRFLLFQLRARYSWLGNPVRKIIALILAVVFYTAPATVGLIYGWMVWLGGYGVNWEVIRAVTLFNVIAVIFVVHIYETVFLIRQTESDRKRQENLALARTEAELEALKSQIDPHFIFNSLNALTHLIDTSPRQATLFTENLADVYRYILQKKGSDVVLLEEELNFLDIYIQLLLIRFGKALELMVYIDEKQVKAAFIPPISLQLLVENIVKHNEMDEQNPVEVAIRIEDDSLVVSNTLRRKQLQKPTPGIGLKNLGERLRLLTGREIEIRETEQEFIVTLPLIYTTTV